MGLEPASRPSLVRGGGGCRAAVALLFAFTATATAAACQVEKRASVALDRAGGLLLVPVTVNGVAAEFILDTGSERTIVGVAAAGTLRIARDEWVSTDMQGTGGRDRRRLGRPGSVVLGGLPLRRHTVAADNSVVVGPIPETVAGHPVAGLLGQDFLSPYDIELDPAAATLTLYAVSGCSGRFIPWRGAYQAIAAWRPVRNVLALPVKIGGKAVQAELDTGATRTTITLPGMIQLGLAGGGDDAVTGFGAGSLAARQQHFASVQVGGLPPAPMDADVAPIRTLRSIGALLGADWLASRRVWMSWATDQVFVAATP